MLFNPAFLWTLLGLLLIGAEMFIPGFVIFFFGIGAVVTGILSVFIPGIAGSFMSQGVVWIISTILSFSFFRKKFTKIFKGTILNRNTDKDLGKAVVVIEEITPDKPGRVRYQGTSWKAVSYIEKFDVGETVDIVKEESLTFIVSKHFLDDI